MLGAVDEIRERRTRGRRRRRTRSRPGRRPPAGSRAPRPPGRLSSSSSGRTSSPGTTTPNTRPSRRHLVEVGPECVARAGVLDLYGDVAAVAPDRPVHLADRGGRRRDVVELAEPPPPVPTRTPAEHAVDDFGRHRRRRLLELGERRAVRPGEFLGQRCLEDRHRLPELHRAALELAEHAEDLLGGALLDLRGDGLGRTPAEALAEPDRRPPGHAEREGGKLARCALRPCAGGRSRTHCLVRRSRPHGG